MQKYLEKRHRKILPMISDNTGIADHSSLAEHLRMVHFSLTLTCAALLVAIFLTGAEEVQDAHRQVQEIITSLRPWDNLWFEKYVDNLIAPRVHLPELVKIEGDRPLVFQYSYDERGQLNQQSLGAGRPHIMRFSYDGLFRLSPGFFDPHYSASRTTETGTIRSARVPFDPERGHVTLRQFQEMWDSLDKARLLLYPAPTMGGPKVLFAAKDIRHEPYPDGARWALSGVLSTAFKYEEIHDVKPELTERLSLFAFGDEISPCYDGETKQAREEIRKYIEPCTTEPGRKPGGRCLTRS